MSVTELMCPSLSDMHPELAIRHRVPAREPSVTILRMCSLRTFASEFLIFCHTEIFEPSSRVKVFQLTFRALTFSLDGPVQLVEIYLVTNFRAPTQQDNAVFTSTRSRTFRTLELHRLSLLKMVLHLISSHRAFAIIASSLRGASESPTQHFLSLHLWATQKGGLPSCE